MKRVVCAVFDSAAALYGQPVFVPSVGVALRSFIDEVNNKESAMFGHPDDYTLFYVADFDDATGEFSLPERGLVSLARGKDVSERLAPRSEVQ